MSLLSLPSPTSTPHPAVFSDVQDRLRARHQYLDNWFLAVRMTLGLGLIGYLTMDALAASTTLPVSVMLVTSYLLANVGVWLMMGWSFRYARWVFAGLDLTTFVLLRHLFQFEALVDPNATMVGFLTLMLIAYALYSDPRLSGALTVLALLATITTLVADALRLSPPSSSLVSSMLAYRSHPLRALVLFSYLGTVGLVTHRLSQRLYRQVVAFSRELWNAQHAPDSGDATTTREAKTLQTIHHDLAQTLAPLRTALENLLEAEAPVTDPSMVGIAKASSDRLHHLATTVAGLSTVVRLHQAPPAPQNVSLSLLLDALVPADASERFIVRGARPLAVCLVVPPALYALRHLLDWGLRSTPDQHPITLRCRADATEADASLVTLTLHAPAFQLEATTLDAIDLLVEHVDEATLFPTTAHLDELLIRRALAVAGASLDVVPDDQQETLLRCVLPGRSPTAPTLDDEAFAQLLEHLPHLGGVRRES